MPNFPVYHLQRFFPFRLNELIDKDSHTVLEFIKSRNYVNIVKDIIMMVRYPFKNGEPDDEHSYSAFNGIYHYNKRIKRDYWQKGEETLSILVGDCEDTSAATVTCLRAKGVSEKEVFLVLGYVTKEDSEFLGGHGWVYSKHIPDDKFRLDETTLDIPPLEYPIVSDIRKPFHYHGIVYHPEQLFNDKVYEEVKTVARIGNLDLEKGTNFFMDRKCKRRRVKKHLLIGKAFNRHSRIEKAIGRSVLGRVKFGRMIRKINGEEKI